jgi:hypothetical protein
MTCHSKKTVNEICDLILQACEQRGRKRHMFYGYYPLRLSDLLTSHKIQRIIIAICNDTGQLNYPFNSFLPLPCILIFTPCLNYIPFNFIWLVLCFTIPKDCRIMKAWFIITE